LAEHRFAMESDERLIELANKGDAEAFEALYYRYRDWVYRLAWRFTGDRDLSLDVLQETFMYLLKKLPKLELRARMRTLLYPVVKHLALSAVHRKRRFISNDETVSEAPAPLVKDAESSRAELAAALGGLPEEQREILLMRFVDGLALEEIAVALELASGTVKSRLYRALETLREDGRVRKYFFE